MSEIEEIMKKLGYSKDQARKYLELREERTREIQESREKAKFEMENATMSREIYERKMALIDKLEADFEREDREFQEKVANAGNEFNRRFSELLNNDSVESFAVAINKRPDGSFSASFFTFARKYSKQDMLWKVSNALKEEKKAEVK